jgi:hypothetical protein
VARSGNGPRTMKWLFPSTKMPIILPQPSLHSAPGNFVTNKICGRRSGSPATQSPQPRAASG